MEFVSKEKTVGIIGGMGPEATVDIQKRIIRLTPAIDDIDHIHCLVDNDPKIPSRIKALIEGTGEDPGPYLAKMAKKLESWGSDFLIIPCNTAHYYYQNVAEAVSIPVVHLIDLIAEGFKKDFPNETKVGVAASTAIKLTKQYEKRFHSRNVEVVYPDNEDQNKLLDIIKAVKAGDTGHEVLETFNSVCNRLHEKGAGVVVTACTELSAFADKLESEKEALSTRHYNLIDAAEYLAKETVAIVKEGKEPHTSHSY